MRLRLPTLNRSTSSYEELTSPGLGSGVDSHGSRQRDSKVPLVQVTDADSKAKNRDGRPNTGNGILAFAKRHSTPNLPGLGRKGSTKSAPPAVPTRRPSSPSTAVEDQDVNVKSHPSRTLSVDVLNFSRKKSKKAGDVDIACEHSHKDGFLSKKGKPLSSKSTQDPTLSTATSTKAEKKAQSEAAAILNLIAGQNAIVFSPDGRHSIDAAAYSQIKAERSGKIAAGLPKSGAGAGVPLITPKKLKQLKSALIDPKEAPLIVKQLKDIPTSSSEISDVTDAKPKLVQRHHPPPAKGTCLECSDLEAMRKHLAHTGSLQDSVVVEDAGEGPFANPLPSSDDEAENGRDTANTPSGGADALWAARLQNVADRSNAIVSAIPTPGKMVGTLVEQSGAFDALAGVTGRLIQSSGSHNGKIVPPTDRLAILLYWWGYEIVLPPPTLMYLSSVHSIAGTLFTFLQALCAGGGAPELTPFIRYLSMYIDMEWKAIQSMNKGKGVVLASTWVLPVAVVPRAWDF